MNMPSDLAPVPENDFARYIRIYYDACRERFDAIEAIAGKWTFQDLIPGMSDFDTRFIVRDGVTMADWCRMSTAIGETHLALCRQYPHWARNLEHLPGINLAWTELTTERLYYPEYEQWTFYHTEQPDRLRAVQAHFARRSWDIKNEYFHLKKFCLYYGRYDRTIDPLINLGVHAGKYPLHSRLMHYFSPPVLSAVCLLEKKNYPGKMDAFEIARRYFPDLRCWEMLAEIFAANYLTPRWYQEPRLTELEDALEQALIRMAERLRSAITLVPPEAGLDMAAWKKALKQVMLDPALVIFENAKFSRLMKGRLRFYAAVPAHFDSNWLIANELKRMGENFFRTPFRTYWKIKTGQEVADPLAILDALAGNPLSPREIQAVRTFARLTTETWAKGQEHEMALKIADVFDDFFSALTKISLAV